MASASSRKREASFEFKLPNYISELPSYEITEDKASVFLKDKTGIPKMFLKINDCFFVMRYVTKMGLDTHTLQITGLLPTIFKIKSIATELIMCSKWNGTTFIEPLEPFIGTYRGETTENLIDYNSIIKLPKNEDIMPAPAHIGGKRKNKNKTMRKK
jgi:hypothetical protein